MEKDLQKRSTGAVREKTQYVLTFGVIAAMLYVAQFPVLVIFFFGIFAYFLWKTFSKPSSQGVQEVFEYYVAANEILRDDERRWFAFEIHEVISKGEKILNDMSGAPPLVYYSLGALYHRSGDHKAAVDHLTYVVDNSQSDESTYIHPSNDLKRYVRILRKIERDPAEAPQMSAAVRSLERSRKNRAHIILEESRRLFADSDTPVRQKPELLEDEAGSAKKSPVEELFESQGQQHSSRKPRDKSKPAGNGGSATRGKRKSFTKNDIHTDRKPISEVLHDIYDKNVQ